MKLKNQCFEIPSKGTIERDAEGRFFLSDRTGKRSELERAKARELLRRLGRVDSGNKYQFTFGAIGEQWFGHREFFESGKAFLELGHHELSRDWKNAFDLVFPETHRPIAFNFLHGIELGLKAFLLFKIEGLLPMDLKERRYGHQIQELLIEAQNAGLEIDRCIVIPHDEPADDEVGNWGHLPAGNWVEKVFGKASREEEKRFDCAIGINFEWYARKGTEYPTSIYENQEYMYLATIAGMAYNLFDRIRNTEGFFDQKRRKKHAEITYWLQELHAERRNHVLSEEEAIDDIEAFFDKCDTLPGPDEEPDWDEHKETIDRSLGSGTTNT